MAFRDGDFSARLPADWSGIDGRIAETFNQTIVREQSISREVKRLSVTVGKEGRLRQRMSLPGAVGDWAVKADSINTLLDDLVRPTVDVARTIGAVAKGDLSQSMELEVDGRALKGEFLRSAKLVNSMIEQLWVFTSEVTRVAARWAPKASLAARLRCGRFGRVERPDRIGEPDGRQPHCPGTQYCRGDHRRGQRRPVQEDHRRRAAARSCTQRSHQHHGRPAPFFRVGGDPCGPRGWHRRAGLAARPLYRAGGTWKDLTDS